MKAVILAGGNDKLKPLTFTKPKPLVPLVNKPIIDHIVEYLKKYCIFDISITSDDIREQLIEHLKDAEHVNLSFPKEKNPLGTAGSVKNIGYIDETFVVIQGDIITDINLDKLIKRHKNAGNLMTIALSPVKETKHFGIAEIEGDGRIIRFYEKPEGKCYSDLANTGVYVIEPEVMNYVPLGYFDFARDLFPILIKKGELFGYFTDSFWVDIEQPKDYVRAMSWMLENIRKSVPSDISGEVLNNVLISEQADVGNSVIVGPAVIGDDVVIQDNCFIGPYTCIGDGARIEGATSIDNSVLFEDVYVGKKSKIGGCFIGEYTEIGDGANINDATISGYCRLGRAIEIANGSNIWPFTMLPPNSIVDGTIRRFVQCGSNGDFFKKLSEEEAFYFYMQKGRKVIPTGYVANNIEEFLEILKKVDQRSIYYHLKENFNNFAQWIRYVFNDEELANEIEKIDRCDKKSRKKLIKAISSHIMREHGTKEVIKYENCSS